MSSSPVSRRLAVPTFLLACAPAFGAHLAGIVQDAAGRPVAGAVVVGSSETDVKDANGAAHRWIATSDDAGLASRARCALRAMVDKDQDARSKAIATGRQDAATFAPVERVDRANLAQLRQIIRKHGWPTADLVGSDGMGDVWLLSQHAPADFISSALPHLKAAADRGEVGRSVLALTIDRDLVNHHKPQIYGSQGHVEDGHFVLFDVEDAEHLDERRGEVGLGPIADYKALIEKDYRKPASGN